MIPASETTSRLEGDVGAVQMGVITFAEMFPPGGSGIAPTARERLQQVIREARMAEAAGLAVYGVGEHHRRDFAVSAPAVVLAAIGERTDTIQLTSAATVLGCADPVRVYQDFATLDLLTGGRAEIIAGSGSFKEAPPLFGLSLEDAHQAFEVNLRLLNRITEHELVTWPAGARRSAISGLGVYPRADLPMPVWVAAAHTSATARLAGELGMPMILGWFGQPLSLLDELARAHRDAARDNGHARPRLAIQTHGYLADTTGRAIDDYYPAYAATISRLKSGQHLSRGNYEQMCGDDGHLLIGAPSQVVGKIQRLRQDLGIDRVLVHVSAGAMAHERVLGAIEGLGEVSAMLRTGPHGTQSPEVSSHRKNPEQSG